MIGSSSAKVALCYSGLPNIEKFAVEEFFKKTGIEPSNVDLFCCFWNVNVDRDKIDAISKKFNNSFIFFVEPEAINLPFLSDYLKFPETRIDRVLSMLFIRRQLLVAINSQSNFYEAYIFSRPDIYIKKSININYLFENLGVGHDIFFPDAGNFRNGYPDVMVLANYSGLKEYLSAFDRLEEILNSRDEYVCPESFLDLVKEFYAFLNLLFTGRMRYMFNKVPLHPENITRKNIELSGLRVGFFEVGEIIVKRDSVFSTLPVTAKQSTLRLVQALVAESISDLDMRIDAIFKANMINK